MAGLERLRADCMDRRARQPPEGSGGAAGFEHARADWLSYDEALRQVLAEAVPLPAERVAVDRALGRRLAEGVRARATLPAWDNSAMDGFAVRSADVEAVAGAASATAAPGGKGVRASGGGVAASGDGTVASGGGRSGARRARGVRLPVAGRAYPGDSPIEAAPPLSAVRIMTGAPLPVGFDSVVRVEHTDGEEEEGFVTLHRTDDLGRHVRRAGQDTQAGREEAPAGSVVHSGTMAVLLACGATEVSVRRRPRVGVLSSGSELAGPERFGAVEEGRAMPDTNRGMIAAGVAEAGGHALDLGVAADDPDAIRQKLGALGDSDVLVATGGASMGERDLVKRSLADAGLRICFWRARIRPGSPVSFGLLPLDGRSIPVFGLPGNPASAFVAFHVLVAPFLRALLGAAEPGGTFATATSSDDLAGGSGATHFLRVRLDRGFGEDEPRCRLSGPQGSGLVRSLRDADALAVVPEGVERIARGERVRVMLLAGAAQ